MGLLSSGQTMLANVMTAEGQSITYRRGATTKTLTAMPDDPQEGESESDGLTLRMLARMFAVNVSDLGALVAPEDNDEISWGGMTFQVLPMEAGGRCYDSMDNRNSRIAIHAKRLPFAILYLVGDVATPISRVSKGNFKYQYVNHRGITERVETTDFLIGTDDLEIEPVAGHRIQEQIGLTLFEYDVTSVNNEPCWRWSEATGHSQRRIHTKLAKTTVS